MCTAAYSGTVRYLQIYCRLLTFVPRARGVFMQADLADDSYMAVLA
jgi:hypothetical protein